MSNHELINKFLSYLKVDGRAVLTLSAYATDLKQFERVLGINQIVDIEKKLFIQRCNKFVSDFSTNSAARKLTSVREFLRWIYEKDLIKNDLAKEIEIPRRSLPAGGLRPLSSIKVARLRRAADVKERVILELILSKGMRLKEIVRLKMKDLGGHCEAPMRRRGNPQQKTDRHATSRLAMTEHLRQAMEYYLATYSRGPKSSLIFSERTGREITVRTVNNILRKLAKKAGVEGVTARELRNTFILSELKKGTPASEVAKAVGFQSLSSIERYFR